jgi:hypothetical protein
MAYYGQLYELERAAKDFTEEQRLHIRQELAVPILEQFHAWLVAERAQLLPKSPMRKAFGYALHNWTALRRYTEAGCLAIDNNLAEREMKRIAIGRKNWLFVGSAQRGQTAAVLLSFTLTCQRLGVEPWAYLQDVLTRLPGLPAEQLDALQPDCWQAARATATDASTTSAPDGSGSQVEQLPPASRAHVAMPARLAVSPPRDWPDGHARVRRNTSLACCSLASVSSACNAQSCHQR